MSLFTPPNVRATDGNNVLINGAGWAFTLTGTTTPASVYTTSARSVAHPYPVPSNSAGRFPPIYLDPTVTYRARFLDASGTLVPGYDFDPVTSLASSDLSYTDTGTGATTTTLQALLRSEWINAKAFGAVGDGSTADTTAAQAAINAAIAQGRLLYFPPGTYKTAGLTLNPTANLAYATTLRAGVRIVGAGQGKTIFDMIGTNAPLFDVYTGTADKFILGGLFEGFTIISSSAATGAAGIRLTSAYSHEIRDVHITGLKDYGIRVRCEAGDDDAPNQLNFINVRIENCLGWGINAAADAGHNETSYIYMEHVTLAANGTAVVGVPTSGGMKWAGQVLTMEQCGIGLNQNVGLYIVGQAGLPNTVDLRNTAFENGLKRHILCTGCDGFKARNIQLFNNAGNVATTGIEFDGATYQIANVEIDGVIVRATAENNPYTAFKFSGTNALLDTMRVRNVVWQNFDFAGQVRFNGVRFPRVAQCCVITDSGAATSVLFQGVSGKGNSTPIRMRGPRNDGGVGVAATAGEWVEINLVSALVLASAGLTINTTYNVYLYDNAGVPTLLASATAYTLDAASGYNVMTGDATKLFVGRVLTSAVGGGEFVRTNVGWVNPAPYPGSISGTDGWTWRDTASAPDRIYFKDSVTLPSSVSDGEYAALT